MASDSEKQILEAAEHIFTRHGYEGARMQQIADEAGVNKSMLHYYYRSKERLFKKVYRGAIAKLMPQLLELLNSDLELEQKIPKFVERYITLLRKHPRLPGFVLQEINQNPDELLGFIDNLQVGTPRKFLEQVRSRQDRGQMNSIPPKQLLVNLLSLCVFPFAARPMIQFMLEMNDQEFEQFLEERTRTLSPFILNAVTS